MRWSASEEAGQVRSGMRDAGYTCLNIDDGWHGQRDAHGNIQADLKAP
jgi:alpha-galactosidase